MRSKEVWKRVVLAALPAWLAVAQENAPIGLLRGDLLTWTGTARAGEVTFRNNENHVYQCSFDSKTYFEHANQRITVGAMQQGDRVEVLADHKDGGGLCYARTIQVLDAGPPSTVPGHRPRLRTSTGPTEAFAPRGDLMLAGVVLSLSPETMVLRMRTNEHKTIQLRPDTRYLSAGQALDRSNLEIGTRVFIRAGKNMEGDTEAFQVVWGDILEP